MIICGQNLRKYCCCFSDKVCGSECLKYKMIEVDGEAEEEEFLIQLPDAAWENILFYSTFTQLPKLRLLSRQFNRVCQILLTRGSARILRKVENHVKVLVKMENKSDLDQNHEKAMKCLKYNLRRLRVTYGRFMMEKRCGFIPGVILDRCEKIYDIVLDKKGKVKIETEMMYHVQEMSNCAIGHFNESTIYYLQRPELDLPSHLPIDNRKKVIDMHRIIRDQDDVIYYRQTMVKYLEKVVSNFKESLSSLSAQLAKLRRRELTDRLVYNKKAYDVKKKVRFSSTTILDLPSKVLVQIFSYLSCNRAARIRPVCRMFNLVSQIVLNQAYYTLIGRLEKVRSDRYLKITNHYRRKPYVLPKETPPATPDSAKSSSAYHSSPRNSSYNSLGSQWFETVHPQFFPLLDETKTFVSDLYDCYLNGMYDHRFCFIAGLVLDKFRRWVHRLRRIKEEVPLPQIQENSEAANNHYRKTNPNFFTLYNRHFDSLFKLSAEARIRLWRMQNIDMCWYTQSFEVKKTRRWIEDRDEEIDDLDMKIRGFYESICISNQNVIFLQIKLLEEARRLGKTKATLVPA